MNETAAPIVTGDTRQIVYEFARANTLEGWWIWALMIGALSALLYACVRFYRRDVVEMTRPVGAALV